MKRLYWLLLLTACGSPTEPGTIDVTPIPGVYDFRSVSGPYVIFGGLQNGANTAEVLSAAVELTGNMTWTYTGMYRLTTDGVARNVTVTESGGYAVADTTVTLHVTDNGETIAGSLDGHGKLTIRYLGPTVHVFQRK